MCTLDLRKCNENDITCIRKVKMHVSTNTQPKVSLLICWRFRIVELLAANLSSMLALSDPAQSKSQSNTQQSFVNLQPQIRMVSKKGRCISSYKPNHHFILGGLRSCKTALAYNSIGSSYTSHHIIRVCSLCITMCLSRGSRVGIGCICTHRYPNLGWCMSLVSLISVRSINSSGSSSFNQIYQAVIVTII